MTTDNLTTALGIAGAVVTAAQTSFVTGVPTTAADWLKVCMAIIFAGIGYFTNKQGQIKITTEPPKA